MGTHQKMTRSMADRTTKQSGIKVISQVGHDPEAGRYKRVKEEEERLRSDLRKESMVKRVKERGQHSRLSSGYLEGGDDSDDEGGVSIAAIKNKYKKKKAGGHKTAYSTDELSDDSDIEAKKALRDSDEDSAASKRSRSPAARRSRSRSGSRSNSASSRGSAAARSRSGSPGSKSGSPRSGS